MNQNHVIQRVVVELQSDSKNNVALLDEDLREIINHLLKDELVRYCNQLDEKGTVYCLDRLVLDLGEIRMESFRETMKTRIADAFYKKDIVKSSPILRMQQQQSDMEKLRYFLGTGLLSWKDGGDKNELLPSRWIQNLQDKHPQSILDVILKILNDKQSLHRFITHTSDDVLMDILMSWIGKEHFRDLILKLKYLWDKNAAFGSARARRFHFWKIVLLIFFRGEGTTLADAIDNFMARWAIAQETPVDLLAGSVRKSLKNDGDPGVNAQFLEALSRWPRENGKSMPAVHAWDDVLSQDLKEVLNRYTSQPGIKRLIPMQVAMLCTAMHMVSLFSDQQKKKFTDAMRKFLTIVSREILSGTLGRDFRPSTNARHLPPKDFENDLREMERLLQKADLTGRNSSLENNAIVLAIRELLHKSFAIDTDEQFILFLEKFEPVIQALPASGALGELAAYVGQLKQKLYDRRNYPDVAEFLRVLSLLKENMDSLLNDIREEKASLMVRQLSNAVSAIPLRAFPPAKQSRYEKLMSQLEKISANESRAADHEEIFRVINQLADNRRDDAENEQISTVVEQREIDIENDLYIYNAGLVLIAPFIRSLFEECGYLEGDAFISEDARNQAAMLLQYMVAPGQEWKEYELVLNKLLCGMEITALADLTVPLQEEGIREADRMLTAILEQADVFKNISRDGFRNAFLNREGVLTAAGGHLLLKVSKETFDVVLEQVPWQYHVIRLPWMSIPIIVEW